MISRERRSLVIGIVACGALLALFDWSVLGLASTRIAFVYWLPVLVPGAAVLWLAAADWPRVPHRFVVLLLAVNAFSAAITALLVIDANTVWVFTESAAQLSLLFAVVRWMPTRTALWLGGVTGVVASALPLRWTTPAGVTGALAMCLVWSLGAIAASVLGVYLRTQESKRQRSIDDVRRAQRLELAHDLHDFVAHHVSGIVVQAQASQFVARDDPAKAVDALRRIEEAGQQALASMRRTVRMLREDDDEAPSSPAQGIADLPDLARRFGDTGGVPVHLSVAADVDDGLPPEVTTSAYRIVLEALTNVRKHAVDVAAVTVELRRESPDRGASDLVVLVYDGAGRQLGGDGETQRGFGLVGLRERVTAVGGTLSAGPRDGLGWTVEARLPLPAASSGAAVRASRP
ncbi:MAG: two-component sensor histidine kinase [Streptosporangiales bacterium]|nr:two-component sensor histidine kinase [Streptosporangiales bacterium]